jgi:hypothetical protein
MNLVPTDVQYIIASFLGPFELVQYRKLSKDSAKTITTFLQRTKNTIQLESFVCPICINDWVSDEELTSFFFDIDIYLHYQETFDRLLIIEDCGAPRNNQRHLFCEACEIKCSKLTHLPDFKNKNNQCYRYCINDNWSFVIMEKDRHLYWNQFSAIENYKDEIEDDYENEDENYDDENEDEPQYFYNSNDDYDDQHIEAELYENGYNEND